VFLPAAGGKFLAICSPEMQFLKGFEGVFNLEISKIFACGATWDVVPINWVFNEWIPIKDFRIKSDRINSQSQLTFCQKLNRSQLTLIGPLKGGVINFISPVMAHHFFFSAEASALTKRISDKVRPETLERVVSNV